jgi:hypothetical protein
MSVKMGSPLKLGYQDYEEGTSPQLRGPGWMGPYSKLPMTLKVGEVQLGNSIFRVYLLKCFLESPGES